MRQPDMRRVEALEARLGRDIRTDWLECRAHEMSQDEIAEAWGIRPETLRFWRKAFKFPPLKQVYRFQNGADNPNSLEARARRLGFNSFRAYAASRAAEGWTRKQMASELQCHWKHISGWFRMRGLDAPPLVVTEAQRAASRANIQVARAARRIEKYKFQVQQ